MPGYRCNKCNRKYYSKNIFYSKPCKYCPGKVVRNLKRKLEKPRRDEIDMDGSLFTRESRVYKPQKSLIKIFKEEEDIEVKEDLTDTDFEPAARDFFTKGRCTGADMTVDPNLKLRMVDNTAKKSQSGLIKGRAGRKGTNSVMGKAVLGSGTISANQLTTGKKWSLFQPWENFEWCHLIGDCLGGPTVSENLVAASFSANTYMAAMEMILAGHTELTVEVEAHCQSPHVAEYITYQVSKNGKSLFYREIDAKTKYFSQTNFDTVQSDLKSVI